MFHTVHLDEFEKDNIHEKVKVGQALLMIVAQIDEQVTNLRLGQMSGRVKKDLKTGVFTITLWLAKL